MVVQGAFEVILMGIELSSAAAWKLGGVLRRYGAAAWRMFTAARRMFHGSMEDVHGSGGEVLAKVTPGALVVDDIDLTKISKPKKKTSRSEGPSSTSSLKRKGTQEVSKLEPEETPKKKKKLQKLSEKKTPTEKVAAIAGRTRSSTKTSSSDQAESKENIYHAESTPTKEAKKRKTKTAPIKETQEEETEKIEMEKSPSLASSDSSPASLEATSEGPPANPEHEASSQTPEKSKLSPFKPEPLTAQKDEIVEEAADEDMEDVFKAAASLVQVSLSDISGDGKQNHRRRPPPPESETKRNKDLAKQYLPGWNTNQSPTLSFQFLLLLEMQSKHRRPFCRSTKNRKRVVNLTQVTTIINNNTLFSSSTASVAAGHQKCLTGSIY
ncbi:hypothetical protein RHGRI_005905 [Rhododendron griersonianum]|uniref:Uncharacterized protein n=1 Tax=Rhododendron griersonianum TaxID=479676 RepID=A0AAV6LF16_9ERIC|nr:hypothetical protein RHGRI_005905 [Rhododendron griersonianum]